MRALILSAVMAGAMSLTACAGMNARDQRIVSGAAIGGAAGAVITGTAGGAAVGAIAGGLIGSEVDRNRSDRRYEERARRYDECRRYNSRRECDNRRY